MKISPVSTGTGVVGSIEGLNSGTSPDRLAAAKAAFLNQAPVKITESDTPVDPQVLAAQKNLRSIKMKVNQSTDRPLDVVPDTPQETPGPVLDNNEKPVIEDTKPISAQYAAFLKQKRALQERERALLAREEALKSQPTTDGGLDEFKARFKSEPLRVLEEEGILTPEFYNSFTEYLISGQNQNQTELKALKAQIDEQKSWFQKELEARDNQAEQQVLSEMRKEAELLAKDGDTFELVRATKAIPTVMDLIYKTYKTTGEVLEVTDAMQLVEDQLLEDNLKIASLNKLKQKLTPQEVKAEQAPQSQMRTLTNKDTAQAPLDRRTRAIMAAQGILRR